MQPLRLRNCRVIRADDRPEPTRWDESRKEYIPTIDPAARAEGLAARAARSFVAPMTLPPSAGPFAVGDRVNARLRQMEGARGEAPLWYSAVVERKRGNKYDVVFDDEDVLWGLTGGDEGGARNIPAAFVRREGPADGLIIKCCDHSRGDDGEGPVVELHVLNTEGRWQPARSLYEYVQQNVVEICSVWDAQHPARPADAESSDEEDWPPKWWRAQEVYEKYLHIREEVGDIATLLDAITPRFAGYIVKQRRTEVLGIRYFRVAAQRAQVPLEVAKIIETFAGLLPAKDSVPCRRDQLPAFMQRLVELYQDEDRDIHPTARVSSSIEVRGTTIWTGYTSGKFGSDDWTLMPRRLLAQYQAVPASLNERLRNWEEGDYPEGATDQIDEGPGYRTFLMADQDSGSESGSDDEAAAPAAAAAESSSEESSSAGGSSVSGSSRELTLDWFDKRPRDYYLAVEHAWPPGGRAW